MKIAKVTAQGIAATTAALAALGLGAVSAAHGAIPSTSTEAAAAWASHHQDFCDDDSDGPAAPDGTNHIQHPCQAKNNSYGKVKFDFFGHRF